MEPLALVLQQADTIKGIRVGSTVEKLVLYADDLVLFQDDPGPSFQEAFRVLSHFSSFLGVRVN